MRYLGNKESLVDEIRSILVEKQILKREFIFFDAFCGTGSVAHSFKSDFNKVIINDNLLWAVTYSSGRLYSSLCKFEKLGFDPFKLLNSNNEIIHGFFYNNYSLGNSQRMYFSEYNAARIDYFRTQIECWYAEDLINISEYKYLLASLIESISCVSNTAGVYGAFLKHWDSRALKEIIFKPVPSDGLYCNQVIEYNDKIENIIEHIDCDILYLDPPYTQNQYGTQYHLLETLILNDNPNISKVTGSRSTAPMRSEWSKEFKANILFDKILAKTRARYIIFSYNNDGFMSKDFIEASLKRYGKKETYLCKEIQYKKYQNWKSNKKSEHIEYLFFIELKDKQDITYESPLNYIGSKAKIISSIIHYSPSSFDKFIDAFGGGFNVGINFHAYSDMIIYNDINNFVKELIESFKIYDTYDYIKYIKKMIDKFGLDKSNEESYKKIRSYYNSLPINKRDPRLLYTIILYGYQQQIRFNNNFEFNNPVGMRWFNDKILEKLISFSRVIKERNYLFTTSNYTELKKMIDKNTFVYLDPPYLLTTGSYNDGKRGFNGWNEILEKELFDFADWLTKSNISFMLSYVIEHKGKYNENLKKWIDKNDYSIIELGDILGISGSRRKEILVINYEQ